MNPKQAAFAREYTVDHNATQAAIRAGYSPKTAHSQGPRLLENVEVQEAIADRDGAHADKVELTAEMVINGLLEIAMNGEREANRVRAWELLGKTRGLFTDRVEFSLTDDRIDAEVARLTAELNGRHPADA